MKIFQQKVEQVLFKTKEEAEKALSKKEKKYLNKDFVFVNNGALEIAEPKKLTVKETWNGWAIDAIVKTKGFFLGNAKPTKRKTSFRLNSLMDKEQVEKILKEKGFYDAILYI